MTAKKGLGMVSASSRKGLVAGALLGTLAVMAPVPGFAYYIQNNLVSDIPGIADVTDTHQPPQLVNAWGLARSPTSPWWVSDNGTGLSTLYNASGVQQATVVTIPPAPPDAQSSPTGMVFNPGTGFLLPNPNNPQQSNKSTFIFATEEGTIAAWNNQQGANAVIKVPAAGAVYKGLAFGTNASGDYLFAANFSGNGSIDVFDSSFNKVSLGANAFKDGTAQGLPSGYVPFGIQTIGNKVYVTYALKANPNDLDEVHGAGDGFVDVFDTNGNFLGRVASGGSLNAPWGLALAPGDFGQFSNDLLVGNFGDGRINAFDPDTFAFLGQLSDRNGPLTIDGLWAIAFGGGVNLANNGPANTLFFTAGPNDEENGLFGTLIAAPEPPPWTLIAAAGLFAALRMRRRNRLLA